MLKHKVRLKKRSLKREINLIRNKIYLKRNESFNTQMVRIEFRLNQFITLRLIDYGDDTTNVFIYVNDFQWNLYEFSFKQILEILSEKKNYSCMDEACMDLIGTYNEENFMEDPDTMFWIYCYYIDAWLQSNYDWRLLRVEDAFPILKALYKAGDPKAREVFKIEIVKALLSGYLPAVFDMASSYLNYFEFEEIIWLFEKSLKIVGFHNRSELKTQFFYFFRDKGFQYFSSHNFKKSIKYLSKALEIYPFDVQTLIQLSVAYLKKGNYQLTRALLIYVLDLPSSNDIVNKKYIVEVWRNLGEIYNRLFLFHKAIIACNMAMNLDRNHMNTWDQIAIAYEGIGDFKIAKEARKSSKKKMKEIIKNERKAQW